MKKIKQVTSQIIVFINCVLLCFVCFTPPKKVYADAGVGTISQGKNVLLTILGYMGVELVGTAQVIDTYVQEAWQLFLNGLSAPWTPEAYTLTAIAGMVQWDDTNNVLTIPKDLYNLVSQWAYDLTNAYNITSNTTYEELADVTVPATAVYLPKISSDTSDKAYVFNNGLHTPGNTANRIYSFLAANNCDVKIAFYKGSDTYAYPVFGISTDLYNSLTSSNAIYLFNSSDNGISFTNISRRYKSTFSLYQNVYYYLSDAGASILLDRFGETTYTLYDSLTEAVASMVSGGGEIQDNIYVNGNVNLDDRVISTDNGAQLELDPAVPADQTYTLDQVLDAVLDWAVSNTWPTDLTISDAIPIAIPEAIDTPLIPTAPYVEVPQLLLPSNLPIIFSPECEDFSACLVNGISAVSSDITSFYNSNEAIRNYANIILYIGVSFVALGVIRRHL